MDEERIIEEIRKRVGFSVIFAVLLSVALSISISNVLITPREGPMGPQGEPYTFNGTWEQVGKWEAVDGEAFTYDESIYIEEDIWQVFWYVNGGNPPGSASIRIQICDEDDDIIVQTITREVSEADTKLSIGSGIYRIKIYGHNYLEVYVSINQYVPRD